MRLLYSMNELHIRKIYSLYCANMNGKKSQKTINANYMDLPDCCQLFTKDKKLELTTAQIKTAFIMSKMSVVEESNIE